MALSSKVRTALGIAIAADLATVALGLTGGLPWIGVLAACITSLVPLVGAYFATETVYPPAAA